MTISASVRDDVSSIIDMMLETMETEMNKGSLLDKAQYPDVLKVSFIGRMKPPVIDIVDGPTDTKALILKGENIPGEGVEDFSRQFMKTRQQYSQHQGCQLTDLLFSDSTCETPVLLDFLVPIHDGVRTLLSANKTVEKLL